MRIHRTMALLGAIIALSSCMKEEVPVMKKNKRLITFGINSEGLDMTVTKADAVSSLSSVNWMATSGTIGSDEQKYAPKVLAITDNNSINTGYYWPSTEVSYNYYCSNAALVWNSASHKATVSASNDKDIVAGIATAAYKSNTKITLEHIFARTGKLSLNAQDGYSLEGDAVWKIQSNSGSGTAGTYDIATGYGKTDGTGWSNTTALSQQTFTKDSDLYLIPGSYKVTVTYTLKKGDYVKQFTKCADINLSSGKKNNISATAHVGNEGAEDLSVSIEITAWDETNVNIPVNSLN